MLSSKDLEALEVKKYLKWIEHLRIEGLPPVSEDDIWQTLTDGLVLLKLCDRIKPGCVIWTKVNDPATNSFKKMDNCAYLLTVCKVLGIPSEGINPKEIVQAFHKSQLNALWLIMRQSFIIINGAKNEEEIRKLAQQFEAFANSTIISAEDCEFDPLRQVLYYGEEGEVFGAFHDEDDIDCPRLPTGFDAIVVAVSPSSDILFSWLRGSHAAETTREKCRSTTKRLGCGLEIPDSSNICDTVVKEPQKLAPVKSNLISSESRLEVVTIALVDATPAVERTHFEAISRIQKNPKHRSSEYREPREKTSQTDTLIVLTNPSTGMVADEIDQDELFIESPPAPVRAESRSPAKPAIQSPMARYLSQRSGSIPDEDAQSYFTGSVRSSGQPRIQYSGNHQSRGSPTAKTSQNGTIRHKLVGSHDITLDFKANIWIMDEPAPKSWGMTQEGSENPIYLDQDTIMPNLVQDTSTNLLVSEILDEFDRSQWNRYLEPYLSVLYPKLRVKSSRDRSVGSRLPANQYVVVANVDHLTSHPYYLRLDRGLSAAASACLAKIHRQFLGSHYHEVFGRLMLESEYLHVQNSGDNLSDAKLYCSKLAVKVENSHLKSFLRMLERVSTPIQLKSIYNSTEPANLLLSSRDRLLFRRLGRLSEEKSEAKLSGLSQPPSLTQRREYLPQSVTSSWNAVKVREFYKPLLLYRMTQDPRITLKNTVPAWQLLDNWLRSNGQSPVDQPPDLQNAAHRNRLGLG